MSLLLNIIGILLPGLIGVAACAMFTRVITSAVDGWEQSKRTKAARARALAHVHKQCAELRTVAQDCLAVSRTQPISSTAAYAQLKRLQSVVHHLESAHAAATDGPAPEADRQRIASAHRFVRAFEQLVIHALSPARSIADSPTFQDTRTLRAAVEDRHTALQNHLPPSQ